MAGVRQEQHVRLVDLLEPTDRGTVVEHQPVGENLRVERFDRHGEVLHSPRQVTEPDVDELHLVIADEIDHVVQGDGSVGLPEQAPFDRILVAAAAPRIPDALVAQLAEGGRLVIPVGTRFEQQVQVVRKLGGETTITAHDPCRFVPLVGAQGWEP